MAKLFVSDLVPERARLVRTGSAARLDLPPRPGTSQGGPSWSRPGSRNGGLRPRPRPRRKKSAHYAKALQRPQTAALPERPKRWEDRLRRESIKTDDDELLRKLEIEKKKRDEVEARIARMKGSPFPKWLVRRDDFQDVCDKHTAMPVAAALRAEPGKRTDRQLEHIVRWLREVWREVVGWPDTRLRALAKLVEMRSFAEGDVVARAGEPADFFFWVFEGRVQLDSGRVLRGMAMHGQPRGGVDARHAATVTALREGAELAAVDRLAWRRTMHNHRETEAMELLMYLRTVPILKRWSGGRLMSLCKAATRRTFAAEELILHQGTVPEHVYFILEGRVAVLKEMVVLEANRWPMGGGEWEERVRHKMMNYGVAVLGPGEYFGELTALADAPDLRRTATVVAQDKTEVLCIDARAFREIVERRGGVAVLGQKKYPDPVASFKADLEDENLRARHKKWGISKAKHQRKHWVEEHHPPANRETSSLYGRCPLQWAKSLGGEVRESGTVEARAVADETSLPELKRRRGAAQAAALAAEGGTNADDVMKMSRDLRWAGPEES